MSTPITTIPNRPAGKPVFDYTMDDGKLCRVVLATVGNDGQVLTVKSSTHQIDTSGNAVLDPGTGSPIRVPDETRTIQLSNVIAGIATLYDGWCKYPGTVDPASLPADWTSGSGVPTGTAAYDACYYDTKGQRAYVYRQGMLGAIGQVCADNLCNHLAAQAALTAIGF